MRKVYLTALSLVAGVFAFGQTTETIVDHTAPSFAGQPTIGSFSFTGGNGYLSGTNGFGDTLVVQKFDASTGLPSTNGTIDAIQVLIGLKTDAGNGTTIDLVVWDDNNGAPGNVLGSGSVAISAIDTAILSLTPILQGGTTLVGAYNAEVTLTGVNIPANGIFWCGIDMTNTGSGDTVVVTHTIPTAQNGNADFSASATHSGTVSDAFGFFPYTDIQANLLMANCIYPVITYTSTASVEENSTYEIKAYPNPTSDNFRIELPDTRTRTISIMGMTGQVLKTIAVNNMNVTLNVADLDNGVYFYQLKSDNGEVLTTRKLVVKK